MVYNNEKEVLARFQETAEFIGVNLSDVNQMSLPGNSPLAVAIMWGDYDAVAKLIKAGADANTQNEHGDTALHRAVRFDCQDIIKLLLSSGASVSVKDDDGLIPADHARLLGNRQIMDILESD